MASKSHAVHKKKIILIMPNKSQHLSSFFFTCIFTVQTIAFFISEGMPILLVHAVAHDKISRSMWAEKSFYQNKQAS